MKTITGLGVNAQCENHFNKHLSSKFRENVQDVLPALPNPDDYFLLRWLRGEGRDGGGQDEGAVRGAWSQLLQNNPWLSGPDHTILLHVFRSKRGEGAGKEGPTQALGPLHSPCCPGPGQGSVLPTSRLSPSSHSSEFRPAEIGGHAPQGETHPLWRFGEGLCGGQSTPRAPTSIPSSSGVLGARWGLTTHLPFSTWSSGRPWTLTTSLIGSPQR